MNKRTVINHLDPRAGLWLLLMANIGMFCQKYSEQGTSAYLTPPAPCPWIPDERPPKVPAPETHDFRYPFIY